MWISLLSVDHFPYICGVIKLTITVISPTTDRPISEICLSPTALHKTWSHYCITDLTLVELKCQLQRVVGSLRMVKTFLSSEDKKALD